MKNNLQYFRHHVDSFAHPKFKMLRVRYGWEGEGRFWALNCMIAQAEGCRLNLGKKYVKASVAEELGMRFDEFDEFIKYIEEECELIIRDGDEIMSEETQDNLATITLERETAKERRKKRSSADKADNSAENGESSGESDYKAKQSKAKQNKSSSSSRNEGPLGGADGDAKAAAADAFHAEEVGEKLKSLGIFYVQVHVDRIAKFMSEEGLDEGYLDFVYQDIRREAKNLSGFFLKAVFYPDMAERYRAGKEAEEARRPDPPKSCPECGRATVWAGDRAGCKACGIFWEYSRDEKKWREESHPAAVVGG